MLWVFHCESDTTRHKPGCRPPARYFLRGPHLSRSSKILPSATDAVASMPGHLERKGCISVGTRPVLTKSVSAAGALSNSATLPSTTKTRTLRPARSLSLPELRVLATQILLHITEGIFDCPPSGVGFDHVSGGRLQVRGEEIIVWLLPFRIADNDEANQRLRTDRIPQHIADMN